MKRMPETAFFSITIPVAICHDVTCTRNFNGCPAGGGVVHSEMFPLIHRDQPNPAELFQIWINLPKTHKMVEPHFAMFWSPTIPRQRVTDENGRLIGRGVEDIKGKVEVTRILEPHLSEARILDEDLFRPIADGEIVHGVAPAGNNRIDGGQPAQVRESGAGQITKADLCKGVDPATGPAACK